MNVTVVPLQKKKKKHYWRPLDLRSWDQCNKIFTSIIYKTVYFSQYIVLGRVWKQIAGKPGQVYA